MRVSSIRLATLPTLLLAACSGPGVALHFDGGAPDAGLATWDGGSIAPDAGIPCEVGWETLIPVVPPRYGTSVYDAQRRRVLLANFYTEPSSLWSLAVDRAVSPRWSRIAIAGTDGPTSVARVFVDGPRERLLVVQRPAADSYALWTLALDAPATWRRIALHGLAPSPRFDAMVLLDESAPRVLIVGGVEPGSSDVQSRTLTDVHALRFTSDTTAEWSQLAPAGTFPRRPQPLAAAFDSGSQRVILFGGCNEPFVCSSWSNRVGVLRLDGARRSIRS